MRRPHFCRLLLPSAAEIQGGGGTAGDFPRRAGRAQFLSGLYFPAVVQLVVSLLGYLLFWLILPLLAALGIAIWGLVEGIVILAGGRPVDAKGVPLKD